MDNASYKGEITYENIDQSTGAITIVGKGVDAKGKGSAEMKLDMNVVTKNGGVEIKTVMTVSVIGIVAQFGSRLISDVSDQMFEQFVNNFKSKITGQEIAEEDKEIKGGIIIITIFRSFLNWLKSLFGGNKS